MTIAKEAAKWLEKQGAIDLQDEHNVQNKTQLYFALPFLRFVQFVTGSLCISVSFGQFSPGRGGAFKKNSRSI